MKVRVSLRFVTVGEFQREYNQRELEYSIDFGRRECEPIKIVDWNGPHPIAECRDFWVPTRPLAGRSRYWKRHSQRRRPLVCSFSWLNQQACKAVSGNQPTSHLNHSRHQM